MTNPTFECSVHFRRRGRGSRREMAAGQEPPRPAREPGRVPRVARLMALAIRFEEYLRAGQVSDYSELAELGLVSRPRISQIMNLLNLGPGHPGDGPLLASDGTRPRPDPPASSATHCSCARLAEATCHVARTSDPTDITRLDAVSVQ